MTSPFTIYREQLRMGLTKRHGAGALPRAQAIYAARCGFFIATRTVWPDFETFYQRVTRGLAQEELGRMT